MKIFFENIENINSVNSTTFVNFITEEKLEEIIKVKGKCECGPDCKCGEKCECKKCPLQQAVYEYEFKAKNAEIAMVGSKEFNFDRMIFVGLGKEEDLSKVRLENIGYKVFKFLKANKIKYVSFLFNVDIMESGDFNFKNQLNNEDTITMYSHLIFGFSMGDYNFVKYLSEEKAKSKLNTLEEVVFITNKIDELKEKFDETEKLRENIFFCRDLVNEPANILYPDSYCKIIKELEKLGVEVEILKVKDMEKLGMGSLLAIGQGSDNESHLAVLKWNGNKENKQPIAFVGKGVTFDSGGLSIKTGNYMDTMKSDMGGSAVVVSLIRLLAMRKAKVNAVGVVALVENMPSGKAIKVGDVVKSMSGQTIEILNTDAEGRMILADALYYTATKFNPETIIDLATLTGAICVALGEKYSGVFTNNDDLFEELDKASKKTDEGVWRMPLSKLGGFYDKLVDSDIADVRNTGKTRDGGAITAAQFLQRFINRHQKWAHIDIAATAYVNQECFMTPKHATGYGVKLLNQLVKDNYEE